MNTEKSINEAEDNAVLPLVMPRFDIEREDLYEYNKPKERTRKRLAEMAECGSGEVLLGERINRCSNCKHEWNRAI